MTELAHRRNHDFDVALYWDTNRDELFVVVEEIEPATASRSQPREGRWTSSTTRSPTQPPARAQLIEGDPR